MGYITKRSGNYQVRYRDPNGRMTSRTFKRKIDADRFLCDMEVAMDRAQWIDPKSVEMSLEDWSKEFLLLSRRLAPSTQETYERDLTKYVIPKFGRYRLGRLPADEINSRSRWDRSGPGVPPSDRGCASRVRAGEYGEQMSPSVTPLEECRAASPEVGWLWFPYTRYVTETAKRDE